MAAAKRDAPVAATDWRTRVVDRSLAPAADRAMRRAHTLMAAAARLVRQPGGADLTMQKVAAESGLSLRVLYQHFSGKDDLLLALIEENQVAFARLIEWHADQFDDPLDRLGAALYFATDPRQHSDLDYNLAIARFLADVSIAMPEQVGLARRPAVAVLTELIASLDAADRATLADPAEGAAWILMNYTSFQSDSDQLAARGGARPSPEAFIHFCVRGLGATTPDGWIDRFRVDDVEAARLRGEIKQILSGRR